MGRLESSFGGGGRPADLLQDAQTPADVALVVADQFRGLLNMLPDPQLQTIAVFRMEGRSNKEIASHLDCALRTVERRLAYIRAIWREEFEGLETCE